MSSWLIILCYITSLSLANFVGIVVGFFNVCKIRLRRLLLAASLSFESERMLFLNYCPANINTKIIFIETTHINYDRIITLFFYHYVWLGNDQIVAVDDFVVIFMPQNLVNLGCL
jgi:hypothetical protein